MTSSTATEELMTTFARFGIPEGLLSQTTFVSSAQWSGREGYADTDSQGRSALGGSRKDGNDNHTHRVNT